MKIRIISAGALVAVACMLSQPTLAQRDSFNPTDPCGDVLKIESSLDAVMVGLWAFGYLAKANDKGIVVDDQRNDQMLAHLSTLCKASPGSTFLQIAEQVAAGPGQNSTSASEPGTISDARAFLEQFLAVGADFAALTAALKPTPEDVHAVYDEPLATALIAAYDGMYSSGIAIRPGPGQDKLLLLRTMTSELKAGSDILSEFPGGYQKVRGLFLEDVPIILFRFVASGESSGLSIDGLVHINGHWVLMPKPWRALSGG